MAKKRLLYLGYVGFNNVGDQACYEAFLQMLAACAPQFDALLYDIGAKPSIADIHRVTPLAGVVLGGGSLLQGTAFTAPAAQAAALGLPLFLYGTGIDYFDEAYTARLMDAGLPVARPGMFDGKELDEDALRLILAGCKCGGVRGPLTSRYLSRLAGPGAIGVMGDAALALDPKPDGRLLDALAGIDPALRLAAVNWGCSQTSVFGYDEQRAMAGLAEGARHLIGRGFAALIYPMWDNDVAACQRLCHAVGRPEACRAIPYVPTPNAICTLLGKAALSVGLKLHACVLSARMGTPFISLAYRSKCYDFALSVDMRAQCVSTASFGIGSFIAAREAAIAAHGDAMKRTLARHCALYRERHAAFFGCLAGTLA